MCKYYGYLRVSTSRKNKKKNSKNELVEKQDYERQLYIFNNSGIKFDKIFEEHVSGGVRGDQRKEFNKLLEVVEKDDWVCFTETSRFGRNYRDNFEILDLLTVEKQAKVKFISNGLDLEGGMKLNPYTWLTLSNFFIMDEFQKRVIGYNTSNKLKALKEQGVKLGAPLKIPQETRDKIADLYFNQGLSQNVISKQLQVSRTTIASVIKTRSKNVRGCNRWRNTKQSRCVI